MLYDTHQGLQECHVQDEKGWEIVHGGLPTTKWATSIEILLLL